VPFARQASRISTPGFGCKAFFNHDFVIPAIAEVIMCTPPLPAPCRAR
jgi:hypothetical protein